MLEMKIESVEQARLTQRAQSLNLMHKLYDYATDERATHYLYDYILPATDAYCRAWAELGRRYDAHRVIFRWEERKDGAR